MTGASHLRLTLHRDTDGTAELRARVESAGFAGESAAWFNVREVAAFARALDAYPIDAARPPQLSGGVFSQSDHDGAGEPALEREQLFIAVRPAGRRGTLAVEVRLAGCIIRHFPASCWPKHGRFGHFRRNVQAA